jgi:predicted amino acid dehydrogenase
MLTYRVLGQVAPTNSTTATLYSVPVTRLGTIISSIVVCNQQTTATTFNIAIVTSGTSLTTSSYINYNTVIPGNDTIGVSLGVTMATNDAIIVSATGYPISFSAYGSEVS